MNNKKGRLSKSAVRTISSALKIRFNDAEGNDFKIKKSNPTSSSAVKKHRCLSIDEKKRTF